MNINDDIHQISQNHHEELETVVSPTPCKPIKQYDYEKPDDSLGRGDYDLGYMKKNTIIVDEVLPKFTRNKHMDGNNCRPNKFLGHGTAYATPRTLNSPIPKRKIISSWINKEDHQQKFNFNTILPAPTSSVPKPCRRSSLRPPKYTFMTNGKRNSPQDYIGYPKRKTVRWECELENVYYFEKEEEEEKEEEGEAEEEEEQPSDDYFLDEDEESIEGSEDEDEVVIKIPSIRLKVKYQIDSEGSEEEDKVVIKIPSINPKVKYQIDTNDGSHDIVSQQATDAIPPTTERELAEMKEISGWVKEEIKVGDNNEYQCPTTGTKYSHVNHRNHHEKGKTSGVFSTEKTDDYVVEDHQPPTTKTRLQRRNSSNSPPVAGEDVCCTSTVPVNPSRPGGFLSGGAAFATPRTLNNPLPRRKLRDSWIQQ